MTRERSPGCASAAGPRRRVAAYEIPAPLLGVVPDRCYDDELRLVERAYQVAAYWHRGQQRRSGDPYITHSVAVAAILAGWGADVELICAGLLHDVICDGGYTLRDLRVEFGDSIAELVNGVAKTHSPAELRAWTADPDQADTRVLMLKLADRLHNLRTVRFLPCAKQREKAAETLRVVAPLAHRLGMAKIGRELEEIAAATLYEGPAQPSVPADLRVTRRMLEVAAMLLPAAVRGRWLEEWMGELHTLPARGRVRFTAQLLCGMPRLAAALHRSSVRTATDGSPAGLGAGRGSGGLFRTKVGVLRLLRWVLVSDARTWSLLLPFVVWMAIETGRDNAGDALVCLITVPPVLVAGVEWLRGRLDASPATHRENRENS